MAYFANGSEGIAFDEQCAKCKYGDQPCPIALLQTDFNYLACNNLVAKEMLNRLVTNSGVCNMYKTFESDFFRDPNQGNLFGEKEE